MTAEILLQTLLSGLLIGLIYALVSIGLSMIFGIMDIVNFSHGEFLMLGMYASYWMFVLLGLDPILGLPIDFLLMFLLGALVYKLIIKRIVEAPMLAQIFATFGLMILFRGIAQFLWTPDFRAIPDSLASGRVNLAGIFLGKPQIIAAAGSVLMTAGLWFFLTRTRLGVALEATAQDREAARLMGIDTEKMFVLAWGIGAACAGVAGGLLSSFFPIFPDVGASFILIAFVVVNLGGFGSVAGAFVAGILVGVIEVMGGFLIGPPYKMALVLGLFLLVLMFRPQGLMGRS